MNLNEWIDTTLAEADRLKEEKRRQDEEAERNKALDTQRRILSILAAWDVPLPDTAEFTGYGYLRFHGAELIPFVEGLPGLTAYVQGSNHYCSTKEKFAAWLREHLQHIADEDAFAEGGRNTCPAMCAHCHMQPARCGLYCCESCAELGQDPPISIDA